MKWTDLSEADRRKILFTPCESKEGLRLWIRQFLGMDLPDTIVDQESNSSPMDVVWEMYDAARKNDGSFSRMLAYAARESMKTLVTAVWETLCLVHLDRNVVHGAAIEYQSKKAQFYVKTFFLKPMLRDYVVLDNDRKKEVARYVHQDTGAILSPKEYDRLPFDEKERYREHRNEIVIVVATMASMNGQHATAVVLDEIDIMNPRIYEEGKMIPSPHDGKMPITLLTSSRKFSFGLVQKEIDNASKTGLRVRHWNIIDVTSKCEPKRHLPEEPRQDIYVDDNLLLAVSGMEYAEMSPDKQANFEKLEGFAGCTRNCRIFAACKGRLATIQRAQDPKSPTRMLKPIEHVQNQLGIVDLEVAKAQLLSRKPSSVGLIYPNLDRDIHVISPARAAQLITGEEHPPMSSDQLLHLLREREGRFVGGMDFGYTHNWAFTVGFVDGPRLFVMEALSAPQLEVAQQVEVSEGRQIRVRYNPKVHADSENPEAIKQFKKAGYRIQPVSKEKGSVVAGISLLRSMLRPGLGKPPTLYLVWDGMDVGIDILYSQLAAYHWKLDAAGRPTDIPDDDDDDLCDSLRYQVYGTFGKRGRVTAPNDSEMGVAQKPVINDIQEHNWQQVMGTVTGDGDPSVPTKIKKGSFFFDG